MEILVENILVYSFVIILITGVVIFYSKRKNKQSNIVIKKIEKAKEYGFHEPVSLHPVINYDICIGSGACVAACPEQDILGLVDGKAKLINASHCIGHGACFHACPLQAITLVMGTEKRGVELPHVSTEYETNVPGIFIAGELGGMGLIKNAVEQGQLAMENLISCIKKDISADFDVIIIGAGPAGISASLTAAKNKIKFLTIEQDTLGGTVYSFPRKKIVMTQPMELPLYGKVKLVETSKSELLELWKEVLAKNNISINEQEKVDSIEKKGEIFKINTSHSSYTAKKILLAIGRRGSPRKLGVPGEEKEKVAYRLLEPELIQNQDVLIVGGGDSAIETALLLSEGNNTVTLSYRGESFSRLKPKNHQKIISAKEKGIINILLNSNVKEIFDDSVVLTLKDSKELNIINDLVYIFAGGELPNKFLESVGITITKKFGETVLKHK